MENTNLLHHTEDIAAGKEALLERMLEEAGFADKDRTESSDGRSRQLQNFFSAIDAAGTGMPSGERSVRPVQGSGSVAKRTLITLDIFQKAYDETAKVVFTGNVMCPEVLFAADLVPFNAEALAVFLANSHAAQRFLDIAERNHFTRDTCAVVRCVLGAGMENCLPSPDLIAFASYPCDSASKMFYALGKIYEKEYFLLDMPYRNTEETVSHLAGRIMAMIAKIEDVLGIKMSPDRLDEAVRRSKEAIICYDKLIALYRNKNAGLSFAKSMDDNVSGSLLLGSEEAVEMLRANYAEALRRADDSAERKPKPKAVWQGMRPFYSDEIINYIEDECDIDVMFVSDLGLPEIGDMMNTDDPHLYLARKLLALWGGDEIRNATIQSERMERAGIGGAILFNQWGCRQMLSANQILRDTLARKNIPMLEIDGDFIDSGNYSFSQIRVRIDAFAEVLQRRKI